MQLSNSLIKAQVEQLAVIRVINVNWYIRFMCEDCYKSFDRMFMK